LIHQDITEKQQSEEALRLSESRLRALSDNLPDGAVYQSIQISLDQSPRFTYFSAGAAAVFGYAVDDVLANPTLLYERILEEDRSRLLALEAEALRAKSVFDCEFRYLRPDGETRWINARSAPRSLPNGVTIWEGIALDITSRKEAERQLLLQSQVLNSMVEGVSVTDAEGIIVYTNPAEDRIFGYEPDELLGKHVSVLNAYSPAENQERVAAVIEVLKSGQPWTVYGHLRTAESLSPVSAPAVGTSLLIFIAVYFVVFGVGVYYLLKLMRRPPTPLDTDRELDAGPIRTAGIMPGAAQDHPIGGRHGH
jgi:PAS domain S-box-containing protein